MNILISLNHKTNSAQSSVLIALLFLLFSATCSSQSSQANDVDDLAYHMPSEHILTLPVFANNAQHMVPIIRYTARQPIVKGVTIIIGDLQPNGEIDASLHLLAKTLPDWGWNTLLVMPRYNYVTPAMNDNSASTKSVEVEPALETVDIQKESSDDTSISTVNKTDIGNSNSEQLRPQVDIKPKHLQAPTVPYVKEDYINFINSLTKELNNAFQQGAGYQVIYAKGQSASATIDLLLQQDKISAHALVVNNPYWPNMESNQLLPSQLAKLPIPVLDFISLSDNLWAKKTINDRRIAAKVGLKSLYRQREVFGDQLLQSQYGNLSKELISWTYFLGW